MRQKNRFFLKGTVQCMILCNDIFLLLHRKVYLISTTPEWESHWMILDVNTKNWTIHANRLSFVMNCCSGSLVTVRGFHYFFHQLFDILNPFDDSNPIISRISENGNFEDLKIAKPPFESHFEGTGGYFKLSLFYQRFYHETH